MEEVRPIKEAKDPRLAGSEEAMMRAAKRAREVARRTNTAVIVTVNGKLQHLNPDDPKLATKRFG